MRLDTSKIGQHRYFRILIILFLILTVLRETGYINLSYYKSNIDQKSTVNWSVMSSSLDLQNHELKNLHDPVNQTFAIYCDGECVSGDCDSANLMFGFSYDASPFLWLPLYKSDDFAASIKVNFYTSQRINKDGNGLIWDKVFNMSGDVRGHLVVKGICSRRQARLLIVQSIAEEIRKQIEQRMEAEMKPIEN